MFVMYRSFLQRLRTRKVVLGIYILMSMLAAAAGIYLSSQQVSYRIASYQLSDPQIAGITWIQVDQPVKESELILQKFDAYVEEHHGQLRLQSIKSQEQEKAMLAILQQGVLPDKTQEKGKTIYGYMMMFIMIQALVYLMLFGNDKEQHMLTRLQVTPLSKLTYLVAHVSFAMIATFLPAFLCIMAASLLGFAIGFTLLQFTLLLSCLAFVSVSIAFLINTLIDSADTANMITSALFILTSALSGCFASIQQSGILEKVISLLPQKQLLIVADAFTASWTTDAIYALCYVIALALLCLLLAGIRCRKIFRL